MIVNSDQLVTCRAPFCHNSRRSPLNGNPSKSGLYTTHLSGIPIIVKDGLTHIQAKILAVLRRGLELGAPAPTYRELCTEFGWSSTATARDHLRALARKGYIKQATKRAHRNLRLCEEHPAKAQVPIVGRVLAGIPVTSEENVEGRLSVPTEWIGRGTYFALRVAGDSMRDCGILEGDYVVVRQRPTAADGDIVVALLDDETTVKRFRTHGTHATLVAENPRYPPIRVRTESARIQGIVVGLLRRIVRNANSLAT